MTEKEPVEDGRDRILMMLSNAEDDILATIRAMQGDAHWKGLAIAALQVGFMCARRALYGGKRVGDD